MDIEVVKSLTKTGGAVGSFCVILYLMVDKLFQEPVYNFLGSDKVFILLLIILGVVLTAIIVTQRTKSPKSDIKQSKAGPTVNYTDSSTHNGDNRF
ncbi:hypothetical protein [Marinomonas sp. ef1]|uniref:hypothetical protein n=1 Tax=Marinomonas sp. ef1 TaxID=2005043 RepID=UPI000C288386|nr:hypothetical protein [Marinomonas sp. ef1]